MGFVYKPKSIIYFSISDLNVYMIVNEFLKALIAEYFSCCSCSCSSSYSNLITFSVSFVGSC